MTPAQKLTLKNAILAETDPAFVALRNAGDEQGMADWWNTFTTFVVWRTSVPLSEVAAEVDGVELVGLSAIKLAAYQSLLLAGTVNPSKPRVRAGFEQVFSAAGGTITRPLLTALWKRFARRIGRLYATGTGTDASPGTLVYEGTVTAQNISDALRA